MGCTGGYRDPDGPDCPGLARAGEPPEPAPPGYSGRMGGFRVLGSGLKVELLGFRGLIWVEIGGYGDFEERGTSFGGFVAWGPLQARSCGVFGSYPSVWEFRSSG